MKKAFYIFAVFTLSSCSMQKELTTQKVVNEQQTIEIQRLNHRIDLMMNLIGGGSYMQYLDPNSQPGFGDEGMMRY